MKIAVVDGQGGGIGRAVVERLDKIRTGDMEVIALGTNSHATSSMMKAGADAGATGENPIVHMADEVDVIIGPMAIISANAMMGEITPLMAKAVAGSRAVKLLIPLNRCNMKVLGLKKATIGDLLQEMEENLLKTIK